jgi:hypothetical protein
MSWEAIRQRLLDLVKQMPPVAMSYAHDPEAGRPLRLTEIARWCGIDFRRLYHIRAGRNPQARRPETQRKLSDFFAQWDAGKLVKAKVNGRWCITHFDPASEVPADAPAPPPQGAIAAQVNWQRGTLRIKPR